MQKHFFTFRKILNHQPEPLQIDIEISVRSNLSRPEARQIANQEVMVRIPDYRFIGAN